MSAELSSLHTEHLAPLLRRMQQGDRSAADELIRRAGARLEHLARRMLRQFPVVRAHAQTGDIFQDVSLRLLNALHEVTPRDTRHFFNLASEHIRFHLLDLARRYRRGAPQPLDEHAEPEAAGTAKAEVEELERWQILHEAAKQLPDEEREVFDLRFYHGLTWDQIADVLQVNEKNARRRWDRALMRLRNTLGGWTPPE